MGTYYAAQLLLAESARGAGQVESEDDVQRIGLPRALAGFTDTM
jgi:hypothetical protein